MNKATEAPAIEYITPPERTEAPTEPLVTEKQEQPKPNRAQRRRLQQAIARRTRHQISKVMRRLPIAAEVKGPRCERCNLLFIGRAKWRCQCKAIPTRHEALAREMQAMREAEQASAAEAQRRLHEQREYDDEQHRLAKENGANAID